jgi:predicted nuclease of restriction endonuclease-like (RecB) superfamily
MTDMASKRPDSELGATVPNQAGTVVSPFQVIAESVTAGSGDLFVRVSALIDQAQAFASSQANATLTLRNWYIGRMIDVAVLHEGRAGHDQELVASLAQQLTQRYGRGYDRTNLYRMVQFSQQFPDIQFVASLAQQVSWTHFRELFPLKSGEARAFYVKEAVLRHLGVRDLRRAISRKAWERREIADSQIPQGSAVPQDAFRDPVLLDMLGLADTYLERDLEAAIIREMEPFLLEVGRGWAFIGRQKRMTFAGVDYHLDLLFYSRPLKRLIAVELKTGPFEPSYTGQMHFYLKWLDAHERQPGEEAPIGLILCAEADRDQSEFLELHKDGIVVAEYWTALPPKAELEAKIKQAYRDAQERLARRQLTAVTEDDDDDE